jgi:LEA14-like dessication related protein
MKKILAFIGISIFMFSCDVAQQVLGTYQLTQCKYDYNSISGLSLAGINLSGSNGLSSLNPLNLASLTSAFASKSGSLPLNFTLNLNVTNPGVQAALLNGMGYILEIDGHQMTTGSLQQQLQIAGGQKTVLPINMAFDLKKALSGESLDAIKNLAFNFAGIGNGSSNVTVKLQPSFNIGGQTITSPSYIPVSFKLNR